MCDIKIDGLPFVLTGHIIPDFSIVSLFGIGVLTEAGCEVTFDKKFAQCNIMVLLFYKARKMCPLIFGHFPLERRACPPIMVHP
jgi:hypothetical protein